MHFNVPILDRLEETLSCSLCRKIYPCMCFQISTYKFGAGKFSYGLKKLPVPLASAKKRVKIHPCIRHEELIGNLIDVAANDDINLVNK